MIPVVWHKQSRGNWDMGIFQLTFEKYPDLFPQYNEKINSSFGRAIVMCVGKPNVIELRDYLKTIKSGVVIFASEEDAYYPWTEVMHTGLVAWTQYWRPQSKGLITERVLLGAPYRIKDFKINSHLPKKYLWSFVGQVQNPFRQRCVDVLKTLPNGYLKEISGFGGYCEDGMDYQEYLDIMCQSKFVMCPAGSMSVDSFRLYEAMECNAIPITDKRSPRDAEGFDYWKEVYPDNTVYYSNGDWRGAYDFMEGNDWGKPGLEGFRDFSMVNNWWDRYKQELEQKLLNLAQ